MRPVKDHRTQGFAATTPHNASLSPSFFFIKNLVLEQPEHHTIMQST